MPNPRREALVEDLKRLNAAATQELDALRRQVREADAAARQPLPLPCRVWCCLNPLLQRVRHLPKKIQRTPLQ